MNEQPGYKAIEAFMKLVDARQKTDKQEKEFQNLVAAFLNEHRNVKDVQSFSLLLLKEFRSSPEISIVAAFHKAKDGFNRRQSLDMTKNPLHESMELPTSMKSASKIDPKKREAAERVWADLVEAIMNGDAKKFENTVQTVVDRALMSVDKNKQGGAASKAAINERVELLETVARDIRVREMLSDITADKLEKIESQIKGDIVAERIFSAAIKSPGPAMRLTPRNDGSQG